MVRISTNVAVSAVEFKDGQVRLVYHQRPASGVRSVPVTAALSEHYVAMLAELSADVASAD